MVEAPVLARYALSWFQTGKSTIDFPKRWEIPDALAIELHRHEQAKHYIHQYTDLTRECWCWVVFNG